MEFLHIPGSELNLKIKMIIMYHPWDNQHIISMTGGIKLKNYDWEIGTR